VRRGSNLARSADPGPDGLRGGPLQLHPEPAEADAGGGLVGGLGHRAGRRLAGSVTFSRGRAAPCPRGLEFPNRARDRRGERYLPLLPRIDAISALVERPSFKLTTRTSPPFRVTASPPAISSGR